MVIAAVGGLHVMWRLVLAVANWLLFRARIRRAASPRFQLLYNNRLYSGVAETRANLYLFRLF
jgi:hypothetical protein